MLTKDIKNVDPMACEIALNEIPESVSRNFEADEYVANYFGWECYQRWLAAKQAKADDKK